MTACANARALPLAARRHRECAMRVVSGWPWSTTPSVVIPGVSDFLFAFIEACVARFVVTHERGSRMAFMRCAHAKRYLCRAECNQRTIVRQMRNIATHVTRTNPGGHIADTSVA